MTKFKLSFLFALAVCLTVQAQEKSVLFLNAYLHVGEGSILESATVGVRGENIELIKNTLTYRHKEDKWDTVIDLKGAHMYPGLVAPNSTLGLSEIDAVRATRDYNDVGDFNPHVRTQIAFNVESDVVSTIHTNGVLINQATPRGGIISGTSSIMHLQGWNWEDATVKANDGVHLNWPSFIQGRQAPFKNKQVDKNEDRYEDRKTVIYDFFELAQSYADAISPEIPEQRLAAMEEIFKEDKRLYIHADELQQLLDVLEFCAHFKIKHAVIVGGYDAHLILPQLRDSKIPVMLPRIHDLPRNENDPVDLPYRLPSLLKEGGILFCLENSGDMEAMNSRNIPFLAGHTMGYGLTAEEALMSISLNSCKILGIDKAYGSIEKGKKATLFVSEGPALDMRTNNVIYSMMNGKWVDLGNRQEDLYKKYKSKYDESK